MSPDLIGILGVGMGLLTAIIAVGALNVTLINQSERRTSQQIEQTKAEVNRRFDQLYEEMNRRFDLMHTEMNRRFDAQDERIRGLEQGQSHLSGEFSVLKDYFTHQPDPE